jgi:hypothetical protein
MHMANPSQNQVYERNESDKLATKQPKVDYKEPHYASLYFNWILLRAANDAGN